MLSKKLQVFINTACETTYPMARGMKNEDRWAQAKEDPIIRKPPGIRWTWLGHSLKISPKNLTHQVLHWNPQGKRTARRPRKTWRGSVETEMRPAGTPWGAVYKVSQNGECWRAVADDSRDTMGCSSQGVAEWRVLESSRDTMGCSSQGVAEWRVLESSRDTMGCSSQGVTEWRVLESSRDTMGCSSQGVTDGECWRAAGTP